MLLIQLLFGADRSNFSCECDLNMIGFKLQFPNIRTHKIDFMTTFKDTFQNWTTLRGSNNPAQMGPFFRWPFFRYPFSDGFFLFHVAFFQMGFHKVRIRFIHQGCWRCFSLPTAGAWSIFFSGGNLSPCCLCEEDRGVSFTFLQAGSLSLGPGGRLV